MIEGIGWAVILGWVVAAGAGAGVAEVGGGEGIRGSKEGLGVAAVLELEWLGSGEGKRGRKEGRVVNE